MHRTYPAHTANASIFALTEAPVPFPASSVRITASMSPQE